MLQLDIQSDSPNMLTFFKNEFIQILIIEIFVLVKECPVAKHTSVFHIRTPYYTVNYLVDNFLKI